MDRVSCSVLLTRQRLPTMQSSVAIPGKESEVVAAGSELVLVDSELVVDDGLVVCERITLPKRARIKRGL